MGRPSTVERWGRGSWYIIGIIVFATMIYSMLATLSGLIVPLVIATVIGMLAVPLVDVLERHRVPRSVGAVLVMFGIVAVMFGALALAVNGVLDQSAEIERLLTAGINHINDWLADLDVNSAPGSEVVDDAGVLGWDLLPGLASLFSGVFSGAIAFLAGGFLGMVMLYFILVDWERLRDWVGHHLGPDAELGAGIVDDATDTIRAGFAALTISSLVTALLIGATMALLGLPLAATVGLVTFVTSYVPYLGAVLSATFACLVALGSGSLTQALILLVVILVVQNIIQTVVGTKLSSERLALHPIAGLISTIVGASVAGLLGATLSSPILADHHQDPPAGPGQRHRQRRDRGGGRRPRRGHCANDLNTPSR